jgi:hypothetical protein
MSILQGFEWLPYIEDQLRASIRHDTLDASLSGAFQHPIAFDQPARILTWSELPIVHICQDSCSDAANAG